MSLKYANQLSDGQLYEIYQLFLCKDERLVCLYISRYDDEICMEGKIEIPEFEEEYLAENPEATIIGAPIRLITYDCMEDPISVSES